MAHVADVLHAVQQTLRAGAAHAVFGLVIPLRQVARARVGSTMHPYLPRRRWLVLVFVPLLLAIVVNGLLALRSFGDLIDSESVVSHSHAVEAQIAVVATTLGDAESGQRGYLLTGDLASLSRYATARASIGTEMSRLGSLTANDPDQRRRVAALAPMLTPALDELQRAIDLRSAGHINQAIHEVRFGMSQGAIAAIRVQLAEMNAAEERQLDARLGAAGVSLNEARTTVLAATLADVVLLVVLYWLVQNAFAVRDRHLRAEREARAAAEEAVALRDQFVSVASHELRTPLTILHGNVQLLERRFSATAADSDERHRRESFSVIHRQLARLQALIATMLDITRIDRGQLMIVRDPLDLAALVRGVVEELRPMAEAHPIELVIPSDAGTPSGAIRVRGDALRLEQVMLNLLQNAIKYSPEGGAIRVEVTRSDSTAALAVADRGSGIQPDALPHLFERFYRAPAVRSEHISGMGIGLHVVAEIVALHGGTISATSTEGAGSVFTVSLPLLASPGPEADTPATATASARPRGAGDDVGTAARDASSQRSTAESN